MAERSPLRQVQTTDAPTLPAREAARKLLDVPVQTMRVDDGSPDAPYTRGSPDVPDSADASSGLVKVTWRDAYFDLDQTDSHDYIVSTVGWLIDGDDRFLHIAAEKLPDGGWRAITNVPRECVIRQEGVS